jgi:hypothetical protein
MPDSTPREKIFLGIVLRKLGQCTSQLMYPTYAHSGSAELRVGQMNQCHSLQSVPSLKRLNRDNEKRQNLLHTRKAVRPPRSQDLLR